jgi:HSP20 family molecular chaperone IbpA
MLDKRMIWPAAVTLIVGLVLGFAVTRWSDRHPGHLRVAARAQVQRERHRSKDQARVVQNRNWDPFAEMNRMQQEIDRSIQQTMQQLQVGSLGMPNAAASGYSSALDVRDRGDHFEVRADLPNADQKNVKVTTEGDRELRVSVTQQEEQKKMRTAARRASVNSVPTTNWLRYLSRQT